MDPRVLILADVTPVSSLLPNAPADATQTLLLSYRYVLSHRLIAAGRSNTRREALNIGPLRDLLEANPLQHYRITFRTVLDPVQQADGSFRGRIPAIQPDAVTVWRKGIDTSSRRLNALRSIMRSASADERITAGLKLGALLTAASNQADSATLQALLSENLTHPNFRVRAWSAYALHDVALTPGSETAGRMAALLGDKHWFVRFMAAESLSHIADIDDYLTWARAVESNRIVKRQIQYLADSPWDIIDMPVELPEATAESQETP